MDIIKIIIDFLSLIGGLVASVVAVVWAIAKLFGKNLIDEWFARRSKKYQAQLDAELAVYKSTLDSRLEMLKISYGNVFSERVAIFKEACARMRKTIDYYETVAAYRNYDCKDNVDFEKPCMLDCPQGCIINYSHVIYEMRDYIVETESWFESNEFFFSLDQYTELLKVYIEFLKTLNKAVDVLRDLSLSEMERAHKCFDIFSEFDMDKYEAARNRLIETFRYTLHIPLLSK